MARPRVYTNEQMISALRETKGLVYLAAKRVGCDPDTIYNRAKCTPKVAKEIKAQRGEIVDTAELSLYNAILAGEAWAVTLTLKTLGKDRGYVERSELTGKDGGAMESTVKHDFVPDIDQFKQLPLSERVRLLRQAMGIPPETGTEAPATPGT